MCVQSAAVFASICVCHKQLWLGELICSMTKAPKRLGPEPAQATGKAKSKGKAKAGAGEPMAEGAQAQKKRKSSNHEDVPKTKAPLILPKSDLDKMNAEHFGDVQAACNAIMDNPVFSNMRERDPQPIDRSASGSAQGNQAIFDQEEYGIAMGEEGDGTYKCAGNLWWANFCASAIPGVPVNKGQITSLKQHFFKDADGRFPQAVTIVVDKSTDFEKAKGTLLVLSPLEIIHALLFKVAYDLYFVKLV